MKKLLKYLPLLTICLLFFGYCYLYYYYKAFNIEINSFISTTDIILSFLPVIVLISSIFYSAILIQLYETIKKPSSDIDKVEINNKRTKFQKFRSWIRNYILWILGLYYIPWLIIQEILKVGFDYKPYELANLNLISHYFFLFIIYIGIAFHEKRTKILENPTLIALFLIIFISLKIGDYRSNEAMKVKDGMGDYKKDHVSFQYNGKTIKTDESLVFVGVTSAYLFLYNRNDSTSKYTHF